VDPSGKAPIAYGNSPYPRYRRYREIWWPKIRIPGNEEEKMSEIKNNANKKMRREKKGKREKMASGN
jgi:hypothetical protein